MENIPRFQWDVGTAYDLFISLDVLHDPTRYGLRGNWAAGVRSRLPADHRGFLQDTLKNHHMWPLPWIVSLTGAKDSKTVLDQLEEIPPARRLRELSGCYMWDSFKELLYDVSDRGAWNEDDKQALRSLYLEMHKKEESKKRKVSTEEVESTLDIWANPEKFGEDYFRAIKLYYETFFHEEESRILPALEQSAERAKQLAAELPLDELLDELSQGLRFDFKEREKMEEVVMIPSFWTTPLTFFGAANEEHTRWIFLFGGRPSGMSLVPGEVVPELLHNTLKALADPTRLRILKHLAEEPLTPAELARRLRLRPPTVIHHLDVLRLARLVHMTLSYQGRRYEARREQIDATCDMLKTFMNGDL